MKIQVKFYPLTAEIGHKLRKAKLTATEWRIWSYLIEIEPWGDRYTRLSTLSIMSECEVSKATVYRAIAKFQELELFDFQDQGFSVKNQQGIAQLSQLSLESPHQTPPTPESPHQTPPKRSRKGDRKNETTVSTMKQDSQPCETSLSNETTVSTMRQDSQSCETQPPKPLSGKDSTNSQTYANFIQTLSNNERENFFKFVKRQIENLPKPINDLEGWLAGQNGALQNRWEVYYSNFLASQQTINEIQENQQVISNEIEQLRQNAKKRLRQQIDDDSKDSDSESSLVPIEKVQAEENRQLQKPEVQAKDEQTSSIPPLQLPHQPQGHNNSDSFGSNLSNSQSSLSHSKNPNPPSSPKSSPPNQSHSPPPNPSANHLNSLTNPSNTPNTQPPTSDD